MKKLTLAMAVLLSASAAHADELLCSYYARISEQDKYNSSGDSLVALNGYTKRTVASIIRQDRANYYLFGLRDREDQDDCSFYNKHNRAMLERNLNSGKISKSAIRTIIDNNPLILVQVYSQHIEVDIIEDDEIPESVIRH